MCGPVRAELGGLHANGGDTEPTGAEWRRTWWLDRGRDGTRTEFNNAGGAGGLLFLRLDPQNDRRTRGRTRGRPGQGRDGDGKRGRHKGQSKRRDSDNWGEGRWYLRVLDTIVLRK